VSAGDLSSGPPHPWVPPALLSGSGLLAVVGFIISPGLGVALAVLALLVWVGTITWAVRCGRRRARDLREAGQAPDLRYLQRRALTYFWLILVCFVGATTGVVLILSSPDHSSPAWPLILALGLMAVGLVLIWVFARVVLPRRREQQR
jgi:drug/metabolite transporter (DMT)-like permease